MSGVTPEGRARLEAVLRAVPWKIRTIYVAGREVQQWEPDYPAMVEAVATFAAAERHAAERDLGQASALGGAAGAAPSPSRPTVDGVEWERLLDATQRAELGFRASELVAFADWCEEHREEIIAALSASPTSRDPESSDSRVAAAERERDEAREALAAMRTEGAESMQLAANTCASILAERDEARAQLAAAQEPVHWAQAVLTALNVGNVQSESLLHKKLREVMIAYRAALTGQLER